MNLAMDAMKDKLPGRGADPVFKPTVLPRQTTNYTCGPATLRVVSKLLGLATPSESDLAAHLGAVPLLGCDHEELAALAQKLLPVESVGEGTWHGKLAIANIRNRHSGSGHFVVLLGRTAEGDISYYCPLRGEITSHRKDEIVWMNRNGDLKDWSVNIQCAEGFHELSATPEPHVFVLTEQAEASADDLERLRRHLASGRKASLFPVGGKENKYGMTYFSGIPFLGNDILDDVVQLTVGACV